ncbi:MAG TPA: lysophospholipid acyltransferase family protein [Tepidisphaeraceae bacterium]|nr:lysophospholipid acyltransferase family protein [Tepidisphaeraceae bacterium]
MAKPRNDFLDRLQYAGLRLVSMCLHCWPVNLCQDAARLIGTIMFYVDVRHRKRAIGNIKRSFPDMSDASARRLARESMQQLVMLGVETMFTSRLIRIETVARHIKLTQLGPTLKILLEQKQGVIMLTGHYGAWEVLGYALATLGFETTSVARPLDNPYINEYVMGVRERMGQRIIDKKGATAEVVPLLERKGAVGFIADQNAGVKGMFVDFFGRKASTYKSIGLLAMQFRVPIIVGYARRKNGRFEFDLGVEDIIWPDDWAQQDDPLRYITQRYTKAIEDFTRADPGQYLWVHRRWKTRPKGEAPEQFD